MKRQTLLCYASLLNYVRVSHTAWNFPRFSHKNSHMPAKDHSVWETLDYQLMSLLSRSRSLENFGVEVTITDLPCSDHHVDRSLAERRTFNDLPITLG